MAGGEDVAKFVHEQLHLRARSVDLAAEETRVAGGLAQSQQRFQDLHSRFLDAAFSDAAEESGAVVIAQVVVLLFLLPFQLAVERLLDALRQFGRNLLLRSAQQQRTQRSSERVAAFRRRVLRGEGAAERSRGSQQ